MNIPTDRRRPAAGRPRVLWRLGAVTITAVAVLVACGDDDSPPTTIAPAVTPTTTTTAAGQGDGY